MMVDDMINISLLPCSIELSFFFTQANPLVTLPTNVITS